MTAPPGRLKQRGRDRDAPGQMSLWPELRTIDDAALERLALALARAAADWWTAPDGASRTADG
jgi:hypothetical protein